MTAPLRKSLIRPDREKHDAARVAVEAVTDQAGAFRVRLQPAIDRYRVRGQITQRQADAAERLYRAWATVEGARAETAGSAAWTPDGLSTARLEAARSYREARDAVGRHMWPLVFHVCVMDWTADRCANELLEGRNPTAVMEVLRVGLSILADSFSLPE